MLKGKSFSSLALVLDSIQSPLRFFITSVPLLRVPFPAAFRRPALEFDYLFLFRNVQVVRSSNRYSTVPYLIWKFDFICDFNGRGKLTFAVQWNNDIISNIRQLRAGWNVWLPKMKMEWNENWDGNTEQSTFFTVSIFAFSPVDSVLFLLYCAR